MTDSLWTKKGGTLSDKSARTEFGLEQVEIIAAIKSGKLQYRVNYMHGNPYFRLLRDEVEELVRERLGSDYVKKAKLKKDLDQTTKELRRLKSQMASLEKKRTELLAKLGE
jgi:hypothetical protein